MDELEITSTSALQADSRRKFMTRILGSAAVAVPAIAALTAGASKAKAVNKPTIYCGPNLFQACVFDPVTGVSGVATFEIVVNEYCCIQAITYSLALKNKKAATSQGVLNFDGLAAIYLPIGTPAALEPSCLCDGWTFLAVLYQLEFLGDLGIPDLVVIPVSLGGKKGVLVGELLPAPDSQEIFAFTISI